MIDIFITKHPSNKNLIEFLHSKIREENKIMECPSSELEFYLGSKHCDMVISMEDPRIAENDNRFNAIRTVMTVNKDIPVIHILKGDDTTSANIVRALKLGASDCMRSPFSYEELYCRVMAILSKTRIRTIQREIKVGDYVLIPNFRMMRYEGASGQRLIELPTRECQLLELFFSNPNKILTRASILKLCWGRVDNYTSRTLSAYLNKVRGRIKNDPSLKIETVRTEGVVLRVNR